MINLYLLMAFVVALVLCSLVLARVVKSPFLASLSGVVLVGTGFFLAAWYLRGSSYGATLHAVTALCAVVAMTLGIMKAGPALRAMAVTTGAATLALIGWSGLIYPLQMRAQIEAVADGRPYCVFATSEDAVISGTADLSFLTIDKDQRFASLDNAPPFLRTPRILVRTGPEVKGQPLVDVTYFLLPLSPQNKLVVGEREDRAIHACVPQMNALRRTPDTNMRQFAVVSGYLQVPADLHPSVDFDTNARNFAALSVKLDPMDVFPQAGDMPQELVVSLDFGNRKHDLTWSRADIAAWPVDVVAAPAGLQRFDEAGQEFYLSFDDAGEGQTEIICYPRDTPDDAREPVCVHRFYGPIIGDAADPFNPVQVTLRYPPEWLPHWAEIEAGLTAQVARITITD